MSGSLIKGTEINGFFFRDICLFVFPTKLFITTKKWKHPKFSSMDGWRKLIHRNAEIPVSLKKVANSLFFCYNIDKFGEYIIKDKFSYNYKYLIISPHM